MLVTSFKCPLIANVFLQGCVILKPCSLSIARIRKLFPMLSVSYSSPVVPEIPPYEAAGVHDLPKYLHTGYAADQNSGIRNFASGKHNLTLKSVGNLLGVALMAYRFTQFPALYQVVRSTNLPVARTCPNFIKMPIYISPPSIASYQCWADGTNMRVLRIREVRYLISFCQRVDTPHTQKLWSLLCQYAHCQRHHSRNHGAVSSR
jgi:hypothetical protein